MSVLVQDRHRDVQLKTIVRASQKFEQKIISFVELYELIV